MDLQRIDVTTPHGSYPILIGAGSASALAAHLEAVRFPRARVIVSSPRVWRHHASLIQQALPDLPVALVPDGERAKTVANAGHIYDALIRSGADRGAGVIAVGGGVVGDVAGFAAATYLRGIALAHVPTTLLAQVDSAVGGKTGVNHRLGKNLIGAFHQPRLVLIDPTLVRTLPNREFRAGLYEVIKYGMTFEPSLIDVVRTRTGEVLSRSIDVLTPMVAESCRIKARVVGQDEREQGVRRLLNFGHTAGHALEAVTEYRRFRHGEAIAWGMQVSADLAVARGALDDDSRRVLVETIAALGPLPLVSDIAVDEVLGAIRRDKKVVEGRLHFVLATGVGRAEVVSDVSEQELAAALRRVGVGEPPRETQHGGVRGG